MALVLAVLVASALAGTVVPEAHAVAGGDLEFQISGTLSPFPTTSGSTSFNGSGTGAAHLTGTSGGVTYTTVAVLNALPVSGWATYSELAWPICPLVGSATQIGHVTLGSSALPQVSGVALAVGATDVGTVTGLVITFDFVYTRVGASATLTFSNASAVVYFTMPTTGAGSFSASLVGGAEGVFTFDPVQAEQDCLNDGGSLAYTLTGDAAVAGV